MKQRIFEPFWWSLFGAGGAISALVLPVLIIIFGLAVPLEIMQPPSYEVLVALVDNWFVRLGIVVVISLSMFHAAHRFRFTLEEGLQLQHYDRIIAFMCYEIAGAITLISAYLFLI